MATAFLIAFHRSCSKMPVVVCVLESSRESHLWISSFTPSSKGYSVAPGVGISPAQANLGSGPKEAHAVEGSRILLLPLLGLWAPPP